MFNSTKTFATCLSWSYNLVICSKPLAYQFALVVKPVIVHRNFAMETNMTFWKTTDSCEQYFPIIHY